MSIWSRAAVVLSVVGIALVTVAAVAAVGPIRAGAPPAALVPLILGIGLKGGLALVAAGVMAQAARLERRRQALGAQRAAATAQISGAAQQHPQRASPTGAPLVDATVAAETTTAAATTSHDGYTPDSVSVRSPAREPA